MILHAVLLSTLVSAAPPAGERDILRADATLSAAAVSTDGAMAGTLFLRAAVAVPKRFRVEPGFALDFVRESLSLRYSLALRYDASAGILIPFVLAGSGGESNIVGPFLETRPFFFFGGGLMLPVNNSVAIRMDFSREHVFGTNAQFDRKRYLLGVVIRWFRK